MVPSRACFCLVDLPEQKCARTHTIPLPPLLFACLRLRMAGDCNVIEGGLLFFCIFYMCVYRFETRRTCSATKDF